ncbi:MAG: hypothetical protein ACOH1I_04475 [Gallionellaceae bacterium]
MLEVSFELTLSAYLFTSTGDSGGLPVNTSSKSLRFTCERVMSARKIAEDKPVSGFDFLGAGGNAEDKIESDDAFDNQFIQYLSAHAKIDVSKVMIAGGDFGFRVKPKEPNNGEMGRVYLKEMQDKNGLDIDLILKQAEFDAVWELSAGQKIHKMVGTFMCYKLKPANLAGFDINRVAGILTSTLQMIPGA